MRSPTLSRVLLAAVAALGLGDSADAAQLVTDPSEFSMPFAVGRMPVVADVPLFDPALGTLNRVTLTVHMEVNDPAAILTNTDPVNPTFVFDDRFDFLIRGPGVFDPDNPSPVFPSLLSLGFVAPGQSITLARNPFDFYYFQSETRIYVPPASFYIGYGLASIVIEARYLLDADNALSLDVTSGTFSGYDSATYDYSAADLPAATYDYSAMVVHAPEPATAVIACLGIVLSLYRRQRPRR